MQLDRDKAVRAMEPIADVALGLSVTAAAEGVLRVAMENVWPESAPYRSNEAAIRANTLWLPSAAPVRCTPVTWPSGWACTR